MFVMDRNGQYVTVLALLPSLSSLRTTPTRKSSGKYATFSLEYCANCLFIQIDHTLHWNIWESAPPLLCWTTRSPYIYSSYSPQRSTNDPLAHQQDVPVQPWQLFDHQIEYCLRFFSRQSTVPYIHISSSSRYPTIIHSLCYFTINISSYVYPTFHHPLCTYTSLVHLTQITTIHPPNHSTHHIIPFISYINLYT